MRRYENWLVAVIFVALLVLFALALDVRGDIASLRRDAAYNAARSRGSSGLDPFAPSTSDLDDRLRELERCARGDLGC